MRILGISNRLISFRANDGELRKNQFKNREIHNQADKFERRLQEKPNGAGASKRARKAEKARKEANKSFVHDPQ